MKSLALLRVKFNNANRIVLTRDLNAFVDERWRYANRELGCAYPFDHFMIMVTFMWTNIVSNTLFFFWKFWPLFELRLIE